MSSSKLTQSIYLSARNNVDFGAVTFCTTAYTVDNNLVLQHERNIHVFNPKIPHCSFFFLFFESIPLELVRSPTKITTKHRNLFIFFIQVFNMGNSMWKHNEPPNNFTE